MIPKIIHYCWFGGAPLPKSAQQCIASWRKFFPDYEIKEWNEQNFDVNALPYTHQAYDAKKYAFVSDYARFWIIYHFGGLYFDTDVKILKSFDGILSRGAFMGREAGSRLKEICDCHQDGLGVNPGLGIGAPAGHPIYREILDSYANFQFLNADGSLNTKTVVSYTSEVLLKHGLSGNDTEPECLDGIWILPPDMLCPMDHTQGCKTTITPRTISIHLYDASWTDHTTIRHKLHLLKILLVKLIGIRATNFILGCLGKKQK